MRYIGSNIGFLGKLYRYRYSKKAAYWLLILLPIQLSVHLQKTKTLTNATLLNLYWETVKKTQRKISEIYFLANGIQLVIMWYRILDEAQADCQNILLYVHTCSYITTAQNCTLLIIQLEILFKTHNQILLVWVYKKVFG